MRSDNGLKGMFLIRRSQVGPDKEQREQKVYFWVFFNKIEKKTLSEQVYLSTKDDIGIGNLPYEFFLRCKFRWRKDLFHKATADVGNEARQNHEGMYKHTRRWRLGCKHRHFDTDASRKTFVNSIDL